MEKLHGGTASGRKRKAHAKDERGKERAEKERPVSFCLPGSGRPHGAEPFRLEGLFREAAAEQEGAFRQKVRTAPSRGGLI